MAFSRNDRSLCKTFWQHTFMENELHLHQHFSNPSQEQFWHLDTYFLGICVHTMHLLNSPSVWDKMMNLFLHGLPLGEDLDLNNPHSDEESQYLTNSLSLWRDPWSNLWQHYNSLLLLLSYPCWLASIQSVDEFRARLIQLQLLHVTTQFHQTAVLNTTKTIQQNDMNAVSSVFSRGSKWRMLMDIFEGGFQWMHSLRRHCHLQLLGLNLLNFTTRPPTPAPKFGGWIGWRCKLLY